MATTQAAAAAPAATTAHDPTDAAVRIAIFIKRDLQALVTANYLVPRLVAELECRVLLLVCDFVMDRERGSSTLQAHICLERDVFFDGVEPTYEVRALPVFGVAFSDTNGC
jgi:hypothetical protein